MPDIYDAIEAEDYVRRHVKDRGGTVEVNQFDGGITVRVVMLDFVAVGTAHYGDERSAWETVAELIGIWSGPDDSSE